VGDDGALESDDRAALRGRHRHVVCNPHAAQAIQSQTNYAVS